jgi:hypothetical protein
MTSEQGKWARTILLVVAFMIYTIAITSAGYSSRSDLERRIEILERAQIEQVKLNLMLTQNSKDMAILLGRIADKLGAK